MISCLFLLLLLLLQLLPSHMFFILLHSLKILIVTTTFLYSLWFLPSYLLIFWRRLLFNNNFWFLLLLFFLIYLILFFLLIAGGPSSKSKPLKINQLLTPLITLQIAPFLTTLRRSISMPRHRRINQTLDTRSQQMLLLKRVCLLQHVHHLLKSRSFLIVLNQHLPDYPHDLKRVNPSSIDQFFLQDFFVELVSPPTVNISVEIERVHDIEHHSCK